ncbi:uncharacterized protein LOC130725041 [Lotus japonicus]|uniref:uncharacterized protein LOC130725041 n=1 Tax=Lotus japonicus TaxID=34305 RepID=UPI00258D1C2E|nr:uncharacterized protein LOC130725041 [Lotus japonicus]
MRGTISPESLLFDLEIERTCRSNRAQQRKKKGQAKATAAMEEAQAEARNRAAYEARVEAEVEARILRQKEEEAERDAQRPLREITAPRMSYTYEGSVVLPADIPDNFQIPHHYIQLVSQHQFGGKAIEDAHAHMDRFTRHCESLKRREVCLDTVRMILFHYTLKDVAEDWLRSQPPNSIRTWEDLVGKFIAKFFPSTRIRKAKQEIYAFKQSKSENLYEAWERFQELLRKCPGHNISTGEQVDKFYSSLREYARGMLDAAANSAFDSLPAHKALEIIDNLATRSSQSDYDRENRESVHEVGTNVDVLTSNRKLSQKMDSIVQRLDGRKPSVEDADFDEEVKAMGNPQNNPYSNTYNPGWRNHPNFSWRDQAKSGNLRQYSNQRGYSQDQKPLSSQEQGSGKKSLEEIVGELAQATSKLQVSTDSFINESGNNFKNQEASIKNLENQVGQISKQLSERPPGMFPSNTVPNPRENISAVTLRSGKVMHEIEKKKNNEKNKSETGNKSESEVISKEKEQSEDRIVKERKVDLESNKFTKVHFPPFPTNIAKRRLEKHFSKFVSMFKKLRVDLPFSEVLGKMPQYVKFMKEIISKKRKLSEENDIVELTEECSAILQKKLPPKRRDPGSFTLPVNFVASKEVRVLCYLGASVNLMPLSMFERLNVGELKPTMMMLQLADRSMVSPWGVVEDVLVRVGEFEFPVDFVIIDINEDSKIPLILGRPFLATSQAKINVGKGTICLRVADEKITFTIFDLKPKQIEKNDAFLVEMMDEWSDEKLKQFFLKQKAGASNKKKKKNTQSDQTEKVYSMSMVVNSEQKEENLGNQA